LGSEPDSCVSQDAYFTGDLSNPESACVELSYSFVNGWCFSGCGCMGEDCGEVFSSRGACHTAYAECLDTCDSVQVETPACEACGVDTCDFGETMVKISEDCCHCEPNVDIRSTTAACRNTESS